MRGWSIRIARFAIGEWRGLSAVLLLTLSGVILVALKPWPLTLIVDHCLTGKPLPNWAFWIEALPGASSPTGILAWLAAGTIVLFVATRSITIAKEYLEGGLGTRMSYRLGAALFDHIQSLSLRFHSRKPTGDLVRRVTTDSQCVRHLVLGVFLPLLSSLASLVTMFLVMWQLNPSLALLALLVAPFLGTLTRLFSKPLTERSYRHQQLEGEMMALAEQTLTALPVVQAFGREEHEAERFRKLSRSTLRAYIRSESSGQQYSVCVSAVTAVATAVFMVIGGLQVVEGSLTVGGLLVFLAYLAALYSPMETLAYLSSSYATAAAGGRRVMEIFGVQECVSDTPGAKRLAPPREHSGGSAVRLERVSFGYEPTRRVLDDVSLDARPGETVAIVGPTGAGKTTLVSLIPRFFDPSHGRVLLDGVDVRDVTLQSLRAQISFLLQEPFLVPLTVAENITYGSPEASREEVIAAAVAAGADEFIRQLPNSYDTPLGERGATLSVGERQRIAIARVLLKDSPVLILDEPSSALDAGTEAEVLKALGSLICGRTTFVIAHRLSTIQQADRVVVLDNGRIVEEGTHAELLARGKVYCRLHRLQFGNAGTNPVASTG